MTNIKLRLVENAKNNVFKVLATKNNRSSMVELYAVIDNVQSAMWCSRSKDIEDYLDDNGDSLYVTDIVVTERGNFIHFDNLLVKEVEITSTEFDIILPKVLFNNCEYDVIQTNENSSGVIVFVDRSNTGGYNVLSDDDGTIIRTEQTDEQLGLLIPYQT